MSVEDWVRIIAVLVFLVTASASAAVLVARRGDGRLDRSAS